MITLQTVAGMAKPEKQSQPVFGPVSLTCLGWIHKVHRLFVIKQRAEEATKNAKNTTQYLTGTFGNYILKGSFLDEPLRVAAKVALMGSIFFKAVKRYEELAETSGHFKKALLGRHLITSDIDPLPKLHPLSPARALRLMGGSTETWVRIRLNLATQRISLLGYYSLHLVVDTLKLSSALIELSEVHNLSEIEEEDAKNRVLISVQNSFNGLVDNRENVVDTLSANEVYINYYLGKIKAGYKTQDIIDKVELLSGTSKKASKSMNKATKTVTTLAFTAWKFLKGAVYDDEEVITVPDPFKLKDINFENAASRLPFKNREFYPIPKSVDDFEMIAPSV